MKTAKMQRYYFEIPSANIIECIWAFSFTDAKSKAALTYLPYWNQIQWITPNERN